MNNSGSRIPGTPTSVAEACGLVKIGDPPLLIMCSASVEFLSAKARDLVRELRAAGARTEFHSPGDGDTILQSTNRLLADIPLDALMSREGQEVLRLLVVDNAERLSESETTSLVRVASGLIGSALRIVVLVRHAPERLVDLPVSRLSDLGMIWNLESTSAPALAPAPPSAPARALMSAAAISAESVAAELDNLAGISSTPTAPTVVVRGPKPANATEIRDVLVDLARERAESRGVDPKAGARHFLPLVMGLAAIGIAIGIVVVNPELMTDNGEDQRWIFDCGLHPDLESAEILMSRFDRAVPTRVREQSGGYRVEVGPFKGRSAAEVVQPQVWQLGACRVNPNVDRADGVASGRSGG